MTLGELDELTAQLKPKFNKPEVIFIIKILVIKLIYSTINKKIFYIPMQRCSNQFQNGKNGAQNWKDNYKTFFGK
jgi:hypothetical protein